MPLLDDERLDQWETCTACREGVATFDSVYSYGRYDGALQKLIQLFKYAKVESLSEPLSRLLLTALPLNLHFDLVMAVPMHWRKRWERGFNQAELLALPVARRYRVRLGTNLRRVRYTAAQAGLSESARRENLRGAWRVRRPEEIVGKRILLIDDVLTTGATLRAAAAALKTARAAHVSALTLARVDRGGYEAMAAKRAAAAAAAGEQSESAGRAEVG